MAILLAWDYLTFEALNGHWTHWALDFLMPIFHWGPAWFALLAPPAAYIAWRYPGPTRRVLLTAGVVLLFVDLTNARLLKPFFARLRPCHALEGVRLLVQCGGHYGLPSGHAATTAALAPILGARFKRALPWLILLVGLIGYSRVYVGVHYPLDIAVGWMWGTLAGIAGRSALRLWERRAGRRPTEAR